MSASRSAHGNVREAASWVVERTLATSSPADSFLEGVRERCDPRDHGLLVELVRGCLTWLKRIDHVLSVASDRPLTRIEPELLPLLRIAVYQLLFMDRAPVHAVVNEAVEHARRITHRGGVSFTNGVLRGIARRRRLEQWPVEVDREAEQLAILHSHPEFLVERWLARFGRDRTIALLQANNRRKSPHLLGFKSHGGRELLAENLIEEGIDVVGCDIAPLGLRVSEGSVAQVLRSTPFRRGEVYIQDEASQLAALVPPPQAGERILGLAAAPGGKLFSSYAVEPDTTHLASDLSLGRLLRLRQNCLRLKVDAPLVQADGAQPPFRAVFDRVVVDGPCSGTGTFRKNPELKWRISESEISRLARDGYSLLVGASAAVAVGGLLIWITCSLENEENEDITRSFLASEAGRPFEAVPLKDVLPPCLAPMVSGAGSWRLFTAEDHDGFSVEVMRRSG